MALIELELPWDRQPQEVVGVDDKYGRPSLLFNPALGPIDLATNRTWLRNGTVAEKVGPDGIAFDFDGALDYYTFSGYNELTSAVGTLAIWLPRVGATNTFGHVYLGASSPAACYFQVTNTGQTVAFGSTKSGGANLSGWFNSTHRSIIFVSGGTAASIKIFVDGVDTGHTFTTAPTAWGAGTKNMRLGGYPAGSSWDVDGSMCVATLLPSVWDTEQAREFHTNPWQLFAPNPYGCPSAREVVGRPTSPSPTPATHTPWTT